MATNAEKDHAKNPIKRFLQIIGPGFITGASDDDPSGIGTYAIAGAQLGYAPLWTALVTFPLMAATQFISAKIGLASGRGLAAVLREHYPRWLLYPVVLALILANPDWGQVLRATVMPTVGLDAGFLTTLVAILGTTISPYLWFWQASQEVEEQHEAQERAGLARRGFWRRRGTSDTELGYAAWD